MIFWQKLNKPFFVLAPMANVTDAAFRRVISKYGKPDVMWTEFVSADGLVRGNREILLKDLMFYESERPIVAQFFGANPEYMYEAGKLAVELGFDGADVNMGCPDKSVMKQGAGAKLIKNPELARELIKALRNGARDEARKRGVPMIGISVKTRIGYNKVEIESWIPELLREIDGEVLDALTIHARTMKEMSKVPARWEHVKEVVELRNEIQKNNKQKTLIIGNGDLTDLSNAKTRVAEAGADGAMLGRAIFGNPWLFRGLNEGINVMNDTNLNTDQKLKVMLEHTKLFEEFLGDVKNFAIMKKHYKAYVNGFDGAKELRVKLMDAENVEQVEEIVKKF
jgi:tRNA-dihydrouridine synthase B